MLNKEISLQDICEEVILDLEDKVEAKGIQLAVIGGNPHINIDDMLFERAVYNLVDNGIKYTQVGGICKIEIEERDGFIYISVIDDGPGIEDNKKDYIFDLFYRIDTSRSRKIGGYGVGLSLVKDIIQKLGGSICVMDNKPRSSIFQIKLNCSGNGRSSSL